MVNAGHPPANIRCRPIVEDDLDRLADLFWRGFGTRRTRAFWQRVLACLKTRSVPDDMPRYGYVLENAGVPVGAILLIFATAPADGSLRANVSSWYVDPAFRGYAPLLVSQALKRKDITYLNISAVRHTWPILEVQGYARYSNGVFVALPAVQRSGVRGMRILSADASPDAPFAPFERELMVEHAAYGCVSIWCVSRERAFPFVFRPRFVKNVVPCAQLIYCADTADITRFAGPIGRYLVRHGLPFMVLDANGPIAGLTGRYFDGAMPKYFRGPVRPRLGDLAYTETALFGV